MSCPSVLGLVKDNPGFTLGDFFPGCFAPLAKSAWEWGRGLQFGAIAL